MPVLTEAEEQEARRFRTYLQYSLSFSRVFSRFSNANVRLFGFKDVVGSNSFKRIQGGRCRDLEKVRLLLRNAWCSEIQLHLPVNDCDLIPYANHWAPVQLYYSVYLAIRAYQLASGLTVSPDHTTTLRTLSDNISSRPDLFPHPWRVLCSGNPETSTLSFMNLPEGITVSPISPLKSVTEENIWDSYGLFLKTTRKKQLKRLYSLWKDNQRPKKSKKINPVAKAEIIENLAPTSCFDGLFRLRLRSNYADAESFLLSIENVSESIRFNQALRSITWHTLMTLELLIARSVGKQLFSKWVNEFPVRNQLSFGKRLVVSRWNKLSKLW